MYEAINYKLMRNFVSEMLTFVILEWEILFVSTVFDSFFWEIFNCFVFAGSWEVSSFRLYSSDDVINSFS